MTNVILLALERKTGFEPATLGLGSRCSTAELLPQFVVQRYVFFLKNCSNPQANK